MKRQEKRRIRVENKVNEVIDAYRGNDSNGDTDPLGQYTGLPKTVPETIEPPYRNGKIYMNAQSVAQMEIPTQDADDL